jgi:acetyl-CoA synthetase
VGNKAGDSMEAIVQALLADPRVSAIGWHIEGLDNVAAFSTVALQALAQGVPLVALKAGSSALGAQTAMSHTSSLAGPDALYDALFARCGVARVREPAELLETLKFLHVHGALPGRRIISASCSGGEASLMADLAQVRGLEMPALPDAAYQRMHTVLGDKVTVANPLDYHTYIWGDRAALGECFAGLMDCRFDAHILVLDYPRLDRCSADSWGAAVDAFADAAAQAGTDTGATVVASLPEDLPEDIAHTLLARGVAPMQGLADCIAAIGHAADIGAARARQAHTTPLAALVPQVDTGPVRTLDEAAGKAALAAFGLPVPRGRVVAAGDAPAYAMELGFPVVLKAVSDQLAHKTEAGGVALHLRDAAALSDALARMAHLSERFLVEEMARDVVLELIVGVQRDAQFGLTLTLGAGGVLVELLQDAATLLFPVARHEVLAALQSLKVCPLLTGFRGKAAGDVDALLDAVMAVVDYAQAHAAQLVELDVNPVLVLPKGRGVLAVDALIRLKTP